jgi:hypothetical protein
MSNRKIRFGLWYDFRNPAQWRQPADRLYGEILDQIAWGENNGFDDVWLSEHHFIDDGYLPTFRPGTEALVAKGSDVFIKATKTDSGLVANAVDVGVGVKPPM